VEGCVSPARDLVYTSAMSYPSYTNCLFLLMYVVCM
jgi:hypothetical protein